MIRQWFPLASGINLDIVTFVFFDHILIHIQKLNRTLLRLRRSQERKEKLAARRREKKQQICILGSPLPWQSKSQSPNFTDKLAETLNESLRLVHPCRTILFLVRLFVRWGIKFVEGSL